MNKSPTIRITLFMIIFVTNCVTKNVTLYDIGSTLQTSYNYSLKVIRLLTT